MSASLMKVMASPSRSARAVRPIRCTSGHDIGSHEHIGLSGLETVHHLVALLLGEVAVHLVAVDVHLLQTAGNLFDALFLAGEDDDTL